jgi:hypothetical protein
MSREIYKNHIIWANQIISWNSKNRSSIGCSSVTRGRIDNADSKAQSPPRKPVLTERVLFAIQKFLLTMDKSRFVLCMKRSTEFFEHLPNLIYKRVQFVLGKQAMIGVCPKKASVRLRIVTHSMLKTVKRNFCKKLKALDFPTSSRNVIGELRLAFTINIGFDPIFFANGIQFHLYTIGYKGTCISNQRQNSIVFE